MNDFYKKKLIPKIALRILAEYRKHSQMHSNETEWAKIAAAKIISEHFHDSDWISVDVALPLKYIEVEFLTIATTGKTYYHPLGCYFGYDQICVDSTNLAGYGTPDKITHWRPKK